MIIDCHGHYTTAPKQLQEFRDAQLAGAEPADSPAAGGKGKPVPREAARCGKLVLRPQKPPAK